MVWAHQQHLQHAQRQQQHNWPPQQQWQQPQPSGFTVLQSHAVPAAGPTSSTSSTVEGASACVAGTTPVAAGAATASLTAFEAAAEAAAAAAANGPRAATTRCFNAQDQPWIQQLWYVHDALQLELSPPAGLAAAGVGCCSPPARPGCSGSNHQQQQQGWSTCSGSNVSSSGSTSSSRHGACGCSAVLEVVARPPDSSGRNPDLKVNKNLLLLLHHAGVPRDVFES